MDSDSWSARLSSVSKHYQSALQSRSDMVMGFEEFEEDDDIREEFACPFCLEYFDIVGLCCHIDDEHPVEAKNGARLREAASWEKHVLLKILGDALEALEAPNHRSLLQRDPTRKCR